MKINVGTKNQLKIQAVAGTLKEYPDLFPEARVEGVEPGADLFGHPKSLKETVEGAVERAKKAFVSCDFSFGLESGLMEAPYSKTGFMEISACAVFDGKDIFIGLSQAFEWPGRVLDMILRNEADGSLAFKKLGLTSHEKLGAVEGGIIGMLTKGRVSRQQQTRQSIISALIRLENREMYQD